MPRRKFKTIKHYHEPGDLHELTFSCYRQIKLLTNDAWRRYLARSIDAAGEQFRIPLVAFVFMPEHVHLLGYPLDEKPAIDSYLAALKRPVSADVKGDLMQAGSPLLKRLTFRGIGKGDKSNYWPFRGRPRGRNVDSSPSRLAVRCCQAGLPKGRPR